MISFLAYSSAHMLSMSWYLWRIGIILDGRFGDSLVSLVVFRHRCFSCTGNRKNLLTTAAAMVNAFAQTDDYGLQCLKNGENVP